ncbi:MAG: transcriptional repressor, partial [Verrucomicrobiota bacterium]
AEETIPGNFEGLRMTKQRRVVYDVVRDLAMEHPTASTVFSHAKEVMPSISLATVYNCLETLTEAGAITQVNIDREASRFCPNLMPHAHFFCDKCDSVFDVHLRKEAEGSEPWDLPSGSLIEEMNVAMRGVCPTCKDQT